MFQIMSRRRLLLGGAVGAAGAVVAAWALAADDSPGVCIMDIQLFRRVKNLIYF